MSVDRGIKAAHGQCGSGLSMAGAIDEGCEQQEDVSAMWRQMRPHAAIRGDSSIYGLCANAMKVGWNVSHHVKLRTLDRIAMLSYCVVSTVRILLDDLSSSRIRESSSMIDRNVRWASIAMHCAPIYCVPCALTLRNRCRMHHKWVLQWWTSVSFIPDCREACSQQQLDYSVS